MFTGLIESKGCVIDIKILSSGCRLVVKSDFNSIQPGESIAVNGVCLTVLPGGSKHLEFDLSSETLKLTTLADLLPGQFVNLERALLASTRMGGHYVSGHVDTTAVIQSIIPSGDFVELSVGDFNMPAAAFLLPKGSITLDGVSLTINSVGPDKNSIGLMLVPHTLAMTTFSDSTVGRQVNVEFDYLTRIIAHQIAQFLPQAEFN